MPNPRWPAVFLGVLFLSTVPALAETSSESASYTVHTPILIDNNRFNPSNGVVGGSGTASDPFVISGWQIQATDGAGLEVRNSDAHFVIRDVLVRMPVGVRLSYVSNARIESSSLSVTGTGIDVRNATSLVITGNSISGDSNGVYGIFVSASVGASIISNTVFNFTVGIGVDAATGTLITDNLVSDCGKGIEVSSSGVNSNTVVSTNVFRNSQVSMSIRNAEGVIATGNSAISLPYLSHPKGTNTPLTTLGLSVYQSSNLTINRNSFGTHYRNFWLVWAINSRISENNFTMSIGSSRVEISQSVNLANNRFIDGPGGIEVYKATDLTVTGNIFTDGGIRVTTTDSTGTPNLVSQLQTLTITLDNLVDGRLIHFYKNCSDLVLDGVPVGQVILVNCDRVKLANLRVSRTNTGIQLFAVRNGKVTGNNLLENEEGMTISGANITISNNNVFLNGIGIRVRESEEVTTSTTVASSNVTISDNNVSWNRGAGISLRGWCYTSPTPPCITVLHNNIINNNLLANLNRTKITDSGGLYVRREPQVAIGVPSTWDSYPAGGNYWSDHPGADQCSGMDQNVCPPADGIADNPYYYCDRCSPPTDGYPLMSKVPTADTGPPSWSSASRVTATTRGPTYIVLTWTPAMDDVGVAGYRVYQDNTLVALVPGDSTSFNVTSLEPGKAYAFKVEAGDPSDNWTSSGPIIRAATAIDSVEYWYLIALAIGLAVVVPISMRKLRNRRRLLSATPSPSPDSTQLNPRALA